MTRVYQTRANCWAACLASILDLTLEETDHCSMEHDGAFETTQSFLAKRDMFYLEFTIEKDAEGLSLLGFTAIPDGALLIGIDNSHAKEHAVIVRAECKDGLQQFFVIHDPLRKDGSLKTSYDIIRLVFLCRLLR